jgi:hypothetical protein
MSKVISSVAALAAFMPAVAFAVPFPSARTAMPLLSGAYDITTDRLCQPTMTVTYDTNTSIGTNVVTKISLSNTSSTETQVGKVTFTQGTTAGAGNVSLASTVTGGTTFLIENSGTSGTYGTPMSLQTQTGKGTFTQTNSIYYGKVSGGIVEHAVFGGLDSKGCAFNGSVSAVK